MRIGNTKIYALDIAIVLGSLVALVGIVQYARPLVIAPLDNFETRNTSVLFSLEKGDSVIIDDNPEFSSPTYFPIKDNATITLQPGIYYWKVDGIIGSNVRKLVVSSVVDLRLLDKEDGYAVMNAGTVPLQVTFYENSSVRSVDVLRVGSKADASGTLALGGQYG